MNEQRNLCLITSRLGRRAGADRIDMLPFGQNWSAYLAAVNTLTRSVTKWNGSYGQRLAWLRSYMHFTKDYHRFCHVGDQVDNCKLGSFQDASFPGALQDSAFTISGGLLRKVGNRTFVPMSQEAKSSVSQQHRGGNHLPGCWIASEMFASFYFMGMCRCQKSQYASCSKKAPC